MSIITKPTVNKNETAVFTLSKSELALVQSVIDDPYFSDPTNWSRVRICYEDPTGKQREVVVFDATQVSPTGEFKVSDKAGDEFLARKIIIDDFDGGTFSIYRGQFDSNGIAEEDFDVLFNLILGYSLFSWGATDNSFSNTGFSPSTPSLNTVPQRVPGIDANEIHKLSRSDRKIMLIKSDGTLWGIGSNTAGELGLGTSISSVNTLTQIGTDSDWSDVFAFNDCAFAIKTDGTLHGTGRFSGGSSGNGQSLSYYGYTTPNLEFVQLSSETNWKSVNFSMDKTSFFSAYYSLAIKTDGTLWATGNNSWGQLGLGNTTPVNTWTQVGSDTDWKEVLCVGAVSIAIKNNGKLYISGTTRFLSGGAVENLYINNIRTVGAPTNQFSEVLVIDNVKTFSAFTFNGTQENCIIVKNDGTLWGIGTNGLGVLGVGDGSPRDANFVQIGVDADWEKVGMCRFNSFAKKENGVLYATGINANFFLGFYSGSGLTTFTAPYTQIPVDSFTTSDNHILVTRALPSEYNKNIFSVYNQGFKIGTTSITNTSVGSISSDYISSFAGFESGNAYTFIHPEGSDLTTTNNRPSDASLRFSQKGTSISPNYLVIDLGSERTFNSLYAFTGSSNTSSPTCNRIAIDTASNNQLNTASSPNWTSISFTNQPSEIENGYLIVPNTNTPAGGSFAAVATFEPITARYIKIRCYYEGNATTMPYLYSIKLFNVT